MSDGGDSDEEAARLVASILTSRPAEALRRLDSDDRELGKFVKNYAGLPDPADLEVRSSIREDAVLAEVGRLLREIKGSVSVVDACCGLAGLPRRMITAIGAEVNRIAYVAIERDASCVDMIRTFEEEFRVFGSFKTILRDVCDLDGLKVTPAHLVILNNVIHEIPPRYFPTMFSGLQALLEPSHGHICVIDMEVLPVTAPESVAIQWTGDEVADFLRAGGFTPALTKHPKVVQVFQLRVAPVPKLNAGAMIETIKRQLATKLSHAIKLRRKAEANLAAGNAYYGEWVVATGQLARLAEELHALSDFPLAGPALDST